MTKKKEKPLYIQLSERDDFSDLLRLVPGWVWGAVIWYAFSKLIIDSLSEGKPGTELNLALLAVDIVSALPPGVALAAKVDVFLTALPVIEAIDPSNFIDRILKIMQLP